MSLLKDLQAALTTQKNTDYLVDEIRKQAQQYAENLLCPHRIGDIIPKPNGFLQLANEMTITDIKIEIHNYTAYWVFWGYFINKDGTISSSRTTSSCKVKEI